jgi:predicted nucleic acid-binding protein
MLGEIEAGYRGGMKRHGVGRIMSFDSGFDAVEGIERVR